MLRKVDSSNEKIAQNWFEGAISLDDALLQVTPVNVNNSWPLVGKKASESLSSMGHTDLMELDKEGVTALLTLSRTLNTAKRNRKSILKDYLKKKKKSELQELCRERDLDDNGLLEKLRERLLEGK